MACAGRGRLGRAATRRGYRDACSLPILGVYEVLNLGLTWVTSFSSSDLRVNSDRFQPATGLDLYARRLVAGDRDRGSGPGGPAAWCSRLVLTEIPAYRELAGLAAEASISPRTLMILSYALCGFTHVASMGIFVGGVAALAPGRRDELAALGPRALLGATIATLMTGAVRRPVLPRSARRAGLARTVLAVRAGQIRRVVGDDRVLRAPR